jgi:hypothetical protein
MSSDIQDPTEQAAAFGALGGKARAQRLNPEQRKAIAQAAAEARGARRQADAERRALSTICGATDRPLRIGDVEIPCYVLEGGRRVLHQRGLVAALGMSRGGSSRGGGDRLAYFVAQKTLQPFVPNHLVEVTKEPVLFRTPRGQLAYGYDATVLADICEAILAARQAGKLSPQQYHIADKAVILVRGFARVGIIALVDEATGYQEIRSRAALEEILNKYLSEELRKWTKTFPNEYFEQISRLRGWRFPPTSMKRPHAVAHYTNDLIYSRLAPGVLNELRRLNPSDGHGRRKHKHFQFLTEEHGDPRLREHIERVTFLMSASATWPEFYRLVQ